MPFSLPWCTGVSDLLLAVGRPPLVEEYGVLQEFQIDTPDGCLTITQVDQLTLHLMKGDGRLAHDLTAMGSCDCSYALGQVARFRVNVFRQNGRPAIVRNYPDQAIRHRSLPGPGR